MGKACVFLVQGSLWYRATIRTALWLVPSLYSDHKQASLFVFAQNIVPQWQYIGLFVYGLAVTV